MSRPKGSKNALTAKPKEIEFSLDERIDLLANLLIEIICEELCSTK